MALVLARREADGSEMASGALVVARQGMSRGPNTANGTPLSLLRNYREISNSWSRGSNNAENMRLWPRYRQRARDQAITQGEGLCGVHRLVGQARLDRLQETFLQAPLRDSRLVPAPHRRRPALWKSVFPLASLESLVWRWEA